jgi:hypothetical protein
MWKLLLEGSWLQTSVAKIFLWNVSKYLSGKNLGMVVHTCHPGQGGKLEYEDYDPNKP